MERQRRWRQSLLTTSTHDTKRSEDVRARLNVLSEIPREWQAAVILWSRLNSAKKTRINGILAPDANDEYFLYQTLIATWPGSHSEHDSFRDRIVSYMRKATKEAKVHTSWINPNEAYDNAVELFVTAVLDPQDNAFVTAFQPLQDRVAHYGYLNSLAQVMLKLTSLECLTSIRAMSCGILASSTRIIAGLLTLHAACTFCGAFLTN